MQLRPRMLAIVLLALIGAGCRQKSTAARTASIVREVTDSGHHFGVADLVLSQSKLQLFWKRPDGTRIGTFGELNVLVAASGEQVIFATNAGIFGQNFSPTGLYVEDGRELSPLNLRAGAGNFYLKPNGVFLIDSQGAAIVESS